MPFNLEALFENISLLIIPGIVFVIFMSKSQKRTDLQNGSKNLMIASWISIFAAISSTWVGTESASKMFLFLILSIVCSSLHFFFNNQKSEIAELKNEISELKNSITAKFD